MRKSVYILLFVIGSMVATLCPTACKNETPQELGDTIAIDYRLPDTLRVATLYGPLSLFYFREDTMGYDFSLVKEFAEAKNMILDISIASSIDNAIAMLDSGEVDVIAYELPVTSQFKKHIYPCGPEFFTNQVLVQNSENKDSLITDVTQLVGREVWVEANSKYHHRLENLNEELGGGIIIKVIERDTISSDEIIEMVSRREIPVSVIDSDVARINKTYYRNIDVSVDVSFAQKSSWGVSRNRRWLGDSITAWFNAEGTQRENEKLLRRYFELSKATPFFNIEASLKKGRISPYDKLFRAEAARIGWDWRLLAAIGYAESQFNNDLVSWAGARGLMQVMPATARGHGIHPDSLVNPQTSIRLGADVIKATENILKKHVDNPAQLQMMVVAAYNSGAAHIIDAITLARKYGKDASLWYGNVEEALLMKSDQRYYTDPDVKYGYFGGRQTTSYVRHVFDLYNRFQKHITK